MGRKHSNEPDQPHDTGRNGYREPCDAPDGRPVIERSAFWASESERLTYEYAVESHPSRPGEGHGSYIVRIAELVQGRRLHGAKTMPHQMGRQAVQRRLNELEAQREYELVVANECT